MQDLKFLQEHLLKPTVDKKPEFVFDLVNHKGVVYTITPELFPSKHRGTGVSLVSTANRTFGVMVRLHIHPLCWSRYSTADPLPFFYTQAPIIALYANLNTPVPIYVSGGVFLFTGAIALLLPFESRGKAAM